MAYANEDGDFLGDKDSPRSAGKGLAVGFEIMAPDGSKAGHLNRIFMKKNGKMVVKHDIITIDAKHQGHGIGANVLRSSFAAYEKMGVKRVEQDCAWVGRYTWAKMGYQVTEEQLGKMTGQLRKYLRSQAGLSHAQIDEVVAKIKTPADIASLSVKDDVGDTYTGKHFLLDDTYSWPYEAHLDLDADDPGYKQMKDYLSKAEGKK